MSAEWPKAYRIVFRFFFTYLVLYFLFMEGFLSWKFSWLALLRTPFTIISRSFIDFVNTNLQWVNFFPYVDILCYFIIAILITLVWTVLDKRKCYPILFRYLHALSRYYLAFVLLSYGLWKITWLQFVPPWPSWLIQPFGNLNPYMLFWLFVGASRSYQFFAGVMEIIPAVLLLFRRTSTLGALIAFGTLVHLLMLNIGYEVPVIPLLIQLLLIALFILSHDLKKLYDIFVVHKTHPLPVVPVAVGQNRYRWIRYGLKLSLIAYVMFTYVKEVSYFTTELYGNRPLYSLHGIYNVKEFYRNRQSLPPLATDSIRWHKLAVNGVGGATVLYMNDSSEYYNMIKVDTAAQLLEFTNYSDSTKKNKLHYSLVKPNEYVFEGMYKNDTVRLIAEKVDLAKLPLFQNRNKVKWTP